jgi:dCMP deaminase
MDRRYANCITRRTHTDISDCNLKQTMEITNDNQASPVVPAKTMVGAIQKVSKRENYLPWDDYFMNIAYLSAMRSKDPSTQVGACIVNPDKRILAIGYNGFPRGISDDSFPWARKSEDPLDTKYPYVCHAEMNAIMNKNSESLKNCDIYVTLFPCNECAKLIIQSGMKRVMYACDKYSHLMASKASKRMFDAVGVEYIYCDTTSLVKAEETGTQATLTSDANTPSK